MSIGIRVFSFLEDEWDHWIWHGHWPLTIAQIGMTKIQLIFIQGVILVSFGSAVKPSQMTKERRAIFLDVFSQLGDDDDGGVDDDYDDDDITETA